MNNKTPTQRASEFVTALAEIRQDRGKMAALRRGLTENGKPQAWAAIAGLGGLIDSVAYLATGGLYAMHAADADSGNIGRTCRQIACARGVMLEDFSPRFNRLVACQTDEELTMHLTALITLAKSNAVPINYRQLFCDLWCWRWYREDIRVRWATEYWHTDSEGQGKTPQPEK